MKKSCELFFNHLFKTKNDWKFRFGKISSSKTNLHIFNETERVEKGRENYNIQSNISTELETLLLIIFKNVKKFNNFIKLFDRQQIEVLNFIMSRKETFDKEILEINNKMLQNLEKYIDSYDSSITGYELVTMDFNFATLYSNYSFINNNEETKKFLEKFIELYRKVTCELTEVEFYSGLSPYFREIVSQAIEEGLLSYKTKEEFFSSFKHKN